MFATAAPLPLALATLVAGCAPATVVVVGVALVAASELAPPMDPENPTGWTPSVAAAQFAMSFSSSHVQPQCKTSGKPSTGFPLGNS